MARSPTTHALYSKLHAHSLRTTVLSSISHLLDWDQETYMPQEGIDLRSEQLSAIAQLTHTSATSKAFSNVLGKLVSLKTGKVKRKDLSPEQRAALREWHRDWHKGSKLPPAFVKQLAEATTQASHVWKQAKDHNDFRAFAPHLEKIVALNRKKADLLGYDHHPYDALLDHFEPDLTVKMLSPLFVRLKGALKELLRRIANKSKPAHHFLYAHCPKQKQLAIGHKILEHMGLERESSRLDLSMHPFCSGLHPKDTRLTTRVHVENILQTLFAVIHEGGHALYNMGLPAQHFGSPLCESVSLGIDESQSRFWETCIGQSAPFCAWLLPLLQAEFPEAFGAVPLDAYYKAVNVVEPSLIRIEADEVTYNLHILLRFELERGLIDGSIQVKEIPSLWNEKMAEYLGLTPQWDAEGCLQDIHWATGAIGYFPTYTLGNLYAAQFMETFARAHPDWERGVAQGDFSFIRAWLLEHIHRHGRHFPPMELCKRITGKSLSEKPFVDYLERKYREIYP